MTSAPGRSPEQDVTQDIEAGPERSQHRRELLKKLGVAGALVWATPIVQTITTSAAGATGNGNGNGNGNGSGSGSGTTTTTRRGTTTTTRPVTTTTRAGDPGCDDEGSGSGDKSGSYVIDFQPRADGKTGGPTTTRRATTTTTRRSTTTTTRGTTTTAGSSPASMLSATATCRAQWWDSFGQVGAWVAAATFTFTHNRHAFLTVEITKTKVNGTTSVSTTSSFYVPANGSSTLEVYDLPYSLPAAGADVASVKFKVTSMQTYNEAWQEQTFPMTGPTVTTACTPAGGTTTTTRPTTTTTRATTTTTRPTTTTTRPTTTTTRRGTTTTTRPTTTTTRRGTTTTTRRGTTTTTRPTTTTTRRGGGDDCEGSPEPGKDISHMDWILCRGDDDKTFSCSDRYGVQYDFGSGWSVHPSGPTSSQHCLAGLSWRVPPSGFSFSGFGSAVSLGGGSYRITLPSDVRVFEAYSKCGQICRRATHLGGNTWRFDPC